MKPYLSVITPTYNRPDKLRACLEQYLSQSVFWDSTAPVEHIVVSDGPSTTSKLICSKFPHVRYYELAEKYKGKGPGDAGRDRGIELAKGKYVCFWNDDNVYYEEALDALIEASQSVDIGIVQCRQFRGGDGYVIPPHWNGQFHYGKIDAMCIVVKTELAKKELWTKANEHASDIRWLEKLKTYKPKKKFVPIVIGEHR